MSEVNGVGRSWSSVMRGKYNRWGPNSSHQCRLHPGHVSHGVETDASDYRYRWETAGGEKIFSNDANYDPRKDDRIWTKDWKLTPAKK